MLGGKGVYAADLLKSCKDGMVASLDQGRTVASV